MATRIERLAQPKANLLRFPDRRSVYWLDELPAKPTSPTTAFDLTPRWSKLSEGKKYPFSEDIRRSPEWRVSVAALKACPSDRVRMLALPRLPAAGWQPDRPLLPTLNMAKRTTRVSARICQLARPKRTREFWDACDGSKASLAAPRKTPPSYRTALLATPKQDHPQYRPDRPVSWPVSKAAQRTTASPRLQTLATPRHRVPLHDGFDPYRVSAAARVASASPRVRELSLPPLRRCRRK
ncbi:sperm microtubule associated protein 2 [Brachyhypopomus gauderio]|uniref:sperm microtubule associated protein 2 n=1 Tax=Brachyhypopomus gauderio TaxID=698409 RepID=UPI00404199C7